MIGEKLIDLLKLLVEFVKGEIDKTVAKTEPLSYGCAHRFICTTAAKNDREKYHFFSES